MVSKSLLLGIAALFTAQLTSATAHPHRKATRVNILPDLVVRANEPVATTTEKLQGCFSSVYGFEMVDDSIYQTSGNCVLKCVPMNKPAIAINGTQCWCSDTYPPASSKVEDDKCDEPCPAWPDVNCGHGAEYFSVWNAGLKTNIENIEDDPNPSSGGNKGGSSSTKGSPTPTAPSVVTIGGETIVVTASSKPEASEKPSGPNKAGIAAGVVVGVVAIAAIAGGLWFWLRAKKRRELAEEHKRQAAINAFVKPDTTGDSFDARLEPAALRRMSDGSIADNQDYSRKILRVTNA